MADLTVPALLVTGISTMAAVTAFLFYRLEKANEKNVSLKTECEAETKALHEAQKQELRENAKTLIELNKQTLAAIDRLCELEERRHP